MREVCKTCVFLAISLLALPSAADAGEWMFRLKDAHVQLRKALFDRDAEAAWEHVDRETRQQAGLLAGQIRSSYNDLDEHAQRSLREKLGIQDEDRISTIEGGDILVADFFLAAHPYLLTGDRDDEKLKNHGTRMAGPTAIVVNKQTPEDVVVPYTFSVEGHFGAQAMDYRAHLTVPTLEDILGKVPERQTLSAEEVARQAVAVFEQAQQAFRNGDVEALWPLLDCDSQSQASHFADQAHQQLVKHPEVAQMLGISAEQVAALDGKSVWGLAWTKQDLAPLTAGSDPRYREASQYDAASVLWPSGYRHRGKPFPAEPVVEFQSGGRSWQIPVRVNYRDGSPDIKLAIRPPFYLRLRSSR